MIEKVKRSWLLIVIAVVVIVFLFIMGDGDDNGGAELTAVLPLSDTEPKEEEQSIPTSVIVDVKGEVNHPGVYEVAVDSRIDDVIKLAGGFTAEAEELQVHLAQKVQDEMTIIIPKIGELDLVTENSVAGSDQVQVNTATQDEMESLSGIGPSKAQAIIQYRDENGLFQDVEDLLNVSGIGEKTLDNIRDDIQIP